MKTHLLKTDQGIALEIDGVVSDKELEFSEEVSKGISELWGIWDVDRLVDVYIIKKGITFRSDALFRLFRMDWIDGFNEAQRLNKEKLFTREDAEKIFVAGGNLGAEMFGSTHGQLGLKLKSPTFDETISSLLPDRVECEVETFKTVENRIWTISPKITDGKYRVLTLIK